MSDNTTTDTTSEDTEIIADINAMTTALSGDAPAKGNASAEGEEETSDGDSVNEGERLADEDTAGEGEEGGEEDGEGESEDATAILLAKLEQLQAQIEQLKAAPKEELTEETPEEIDFLDGKTVDEVAADETSFNALLNRIYRKARQDAEESMLRAIPNVVKASVTQQSTLSKSVQEFYAANPDLAGFKKAVAVVAQEVAGEHPEWDVKRVFTEVEKEARKRLGLAKKATDGKKTIDSGKSRQPGGFARSGTGPRGEARPQLSDLEKEIAEMNKALGNW